MSSLEAGKGKFVRGEKYRKKGRAPESPYRFPIMQLGPIWPRWYHAIMPRWHHTIGPGPVWLAQHNWVWPHSETGTIQLGQFSQEKISEGDKESKLKGRQVNIDLQVGGKGRRRNRREAIRSAMKRKLEISGGAENETSPVTIQR